MKQRELILSVFLFFMACEVLSAQNTISVNNQVPQIMSLNPDNYSWTSQKMKFQYSEWLNYTTLVDYYNEPSFSVTVQVVSKHMPKGLEVRAEADPYEGLSTGGIGTSTGMKTVSRVASVLIEDITSSYTGSGRGQGHRIQLFFSVPKYIKADTGIYKVNVVFTLMQ